MIRKTVFLGIHREKRNTSHDFRDYPMIDRFFLFVYRRDSTPGRHSKCTGISRYPPRTLPARIPGLSKEFQDDKQESGPFSVGSKRDGCYTVLVSSRGCPAVL